MPLGHTCEMPGRPGSQDGDPVWGLKNLHLIVTSTMGVTEALQGENVACKVNLMTHTFRDEGGQRSGRSVRAGRRVVGEDERAFHEGGSDA